MDIEKRLLADQEEVYDFIKSKGQLKRRELDVLIDRYVFDNRPSVNVHSKLPTSDRFPLHYSSNLSDAWKVVDKYRFTVTPSLDGWKVFSANASKSERGSQYIGTTNNAVWIEHEDVAVAICLAGLRQVGIETITMIEEVRK